MQINKRIFFEVFKNEMDDMIDEYSSLFKYAEYLITINIKDKNDLPDESELFEKISIQLIRDIDEIKKQFDEDEKKLSKIGLVYHLNKVAGYISNLYSKLNKTNAHANAKKVSEEEIDSNNCDA